MDKRVLVITQYFAPEPCAAAHRMEALCRALRESGREVTVLTAFPSFPHGRMAPEDARVLHRCERVGDIRVERVWSFTCAPIARRLIGWLSLAFAMTVYALFHCRSFGTVIVTLPHVPLALPALVLQRFGRCKLIVDVRDVFPDIAVAMGTWRKNGFLDRAVGALVDALYARAERIVAVTPTAVEQIVARGVTRSRVLLAPNGFDPVEIERSRATRGAQYDLVFAGNLGLTTGIDVILGAAELLAPDPRYRFIIVGGGAQAKRLSAEIAVRGLRNIEQRGVLPRSGALQALADADVALVTLVPGIVESVPTKLFDAFAARTPVVACVDGEARRLLNENNAGLVVAPHDANALVAAIKRVTSDPLLATRLTENASKLLSTRRERTNIMRELCTQI